MSELSVKYQRKWIKPGIEVAHKENPALKLYVVDVVKEFREIPTGKKESNGSLEFERKQRILGVDCRYLKETEWKFQRFHTRELVPWEVAEKGKNEIIDFLMRND